MKTVTLPAAVRSDMIAHARDEAPNECCGLLIGRSGRVEESLRVRSITPSPTRYLLDPAVHVATNRRLRGTSRAVIGTYHSHPCSPAVPSESDRAEALYSDFVWMIVSLMTAEAEVAAFELGTECVTPIAIILED